jgi:hypothetical protein
MKAGDLETIPLDSPEALALISADDPEQVLERDIILRHGVEVRFRGRTSIDIPVVWDINAMGNWYMRPKR